MNRAYNQTPLDEQPRLLTQFFIGNQQYEFIRPKFFNKNTQTYSYSQSRNIPQPTSNSVFLLISYDLHKIAVKITHFFQQNKTSTSKNLLEIDLLFTQLIILHQTMRNVIIKITNASIQAKDLVLTALINQIFSNHTHEKNKYDNLEKIQHHPKIFINHKTQ